MLGSDQFSQLRRCQTSRPLKGQTTTTTLMLLVQESELGQESLSRSFQLLAAST
jgi:hypothetical protein